VVIESMFETLPRATNRVTLSKTKKDALGIPTLSFHYDLDGDEYVRRAIFACRITTRSSTPWAARS
jgi:hypothetical protein